MTDDQRPLFTSFDEAWRWFAERLDKGNIVMVFADSGWKYLETDLWTRDLPSEEHEENLDDIIWW